MSALTPRGLVALRERDFVLFLSARTVTGLAQQILNVGLGWLVYDRTGSPMALGLVGLSVFVPALILSLVAGAVADRVDRRRIVGTAWAVICLAALGLTLLASTPGSPIWPIYAMAMMVGGARSFANPAGQALVATLVPRDILPSAVSLNAMVWQASSIVGPAIGGLLFILGAPVVFGAVATAFAIGASLASLIRPRAIQGQDRGPMKDLLLGGIRFIWSRPVVLGAISLDLFAVLLGGAIALLPIYARDILEVGPVGLGVLRSAPSAGAVVTLAILTWRPLERRVGRRMIAAVVTFGLAIIVFGLSTNVILSWAALAVTGAADMVSVVVRQTLVQLDTPDSMRGRVSAVNSVFIGASNELGEFESGATAALLGTVPAVVVGGLGTIAVAALWTRLFPTLWNRDRLMSADEPAKDPEPAKA